MCLISEGIHYTYVVSGDDFTRAGEASSNLKGTLKLIGVKPEIVRRVAIAMYEGELNMVIHAGGGHIDVELTTSKIHIEFIDEGPGIPDVELAMRAGYSTAPDSIRALGFGAGMGLPNIKKYSDTMIIDTMVGNGTRVVIDIYMEDSATKVKR